MLSLSGGSTVGCGNMLQAGRSWVRFPIKLLHFVFNLSNPYSRTMALVLSQPPTELSTRNFSWRKARLTRKADKLNAICEPHPAIGITLPVNIEG
jgi:hypothetical protein